MDYHLHWKQVKIVIKPNDPIEVNFNLLDISSYSVENAFTTPCQPLTFFVFKLSVPSTSCSFLFKKNAGKKHRVWDNFKRLKNIVFIYLYYIIT